MTPDQQRGFTLLEVVIALAILALSLGSLYGAFESALSRTRRDQHLVTGTLLAQSLLSRATIEFPTSLDHITGEWHGFSYQLRQQLLTAPAQQPRYTVATVQVIASVSWLESTGSKTIELSTIKVAGKEAQ